MPEGQDGDVWFLGFASRLDPANLPEKMLQSSQNLRLQRGTATPRLGVERIAGKIEATTPVAANYGEYRHTSVYIDPDLGYEYILVVTFQSIALLYTDGTVYKNIPFRQQTGGASPDPNSNPRINLGSEVQAIQALNKVYVLRGSAKKDPATITFSNSAIPQNTWGTFTVTNYQISRWATKPLVATASDITITLGKNNGFSVGDIISVYASTYAGLVNQNLGITSTTDTEIIIEVLGLTPGSGTISFALYNDVYHNEFIIQVNDQSKKHFNGTYAVQSPTLAGMLAGTFTFNFYNDTGNNVSSNTNQPGTILEAKSPIVWDGVSNYAYPVQQDNYMTGTTANVPPADFGLYFQNRLVLKTANHYVAVSDILSDTFDMQLNNFNINLGSGDSIVGFLPWIENQFLVFMTKAIYVVFVETTNYVSGPPGVNSSITVITNEIGCLARRTIVNAGQFVFFLSTKGVHMLSPQLDLKLLGNTVPLSEPVADIFAGINYNAVKHACAAYYDNRFYITIPWNNSKYNNRTLLYNTLNQAWESVDVFQEGMFIDEYFVCAYGNERRLMAGCRIWRGWWTADYIDQLDASGIALFDQIEGEDAFSLQNNGGNIVPLASQIISTLRTREYTFDGPAGKQFTRAQVQCNNQQGDQIEIYANTHDPDATELVLGYTFSTNEDSTLRPRIALRGSGIDLSVNITNGNPSIKSVSVSAFSTDRKMISEE